MKLFLKWHEQSNIPISLSFNFTHLKRNMVEMMTPCHSTSAGKEDHWSRPYEVPASGPAAALSIFSLPSSPFYTLSLAIYNVVLLPNIIFQFHIEISIDSISYFSL